MAGPLAKYPGALKSRAKAAGMSVEKFAESNIHADGVVGKLARMYYLSGSGGTHGSGKSKMDGSGDKRTLGQKIYQIG